MHKQGLFACKRSLLFSGRQLGRSCPAPFFFLSDSGGGLWVQPVKSSRQGGTAACRAQEQGTGKRASTLLIYMFMHKYREQLLAHYQCLVLVIHSYTHLSRLSCPVVLCCGACSGLLVVRQALPCCLCMVLCLCGGKSFTGVLIPYLYTGFSTPFVDSIVLPVSVLVWLSTGGRE